MVHGVTDADGRTLDSDDLSHSDEVSHRAGCLTEEAGALLAAQSDDGFLDLDVAVKQAVQPPSPLVPQPWPAPAQTRELRMTHAATRVQAGVPTGGRFAVGPRPESDVQLMSTCTGADRVLVTDMTGDQYLLTPGVIADDADSVFRNGQCLALAVAVSRRTRWPIALTGFDLGAVPARIGASP